METSVFQPWMSEQARDRFHRRLAADVRRPGFALLVAESEVLTGCAYGFPLCGEGPWRQSFDGYLPGNLARPATSGRLFAISGIVVRTEVRIRHQDQDWNLARRLQKRLLEDHGAALGVTLVSRADVETLRAFRAWGWRDIDDLLPPAPCHVLTLSP